MEKTRAVETAATLVVRGGRRFARWYVVAMLAFGSLWAVGAFVNGMQYADRSSVFMHVITAVIMAGMASIVAALPVAIVSFVLFAAFAK